jgi:hypothetical protein
VTKATKADAGNYTCTHANAVSDSVMVFIIEGKPSQIFYPKNYMIKLTFFYLFEGAHPRANVMAGAITLNMSPKYNITIIIMSIIIKNIIK